MIAFAIFLIFASGCFFGATLDKGSDEAAAPLFASALILAAGIAIFVLTK